MDTKKYLSYDGLEQYDGLIKNEIITSSANTLLDAKSHADNHLITAQSYTDDAVAQKSLVQIITWGADD